MITKTTSLQKFYQNTLEEFETNNLLHLKLSNYHFCIRSNHAPLIEKLKSYFSEFLLAEEFFDTPIDRDIIAIESAPLEVQAEDLTVKNPEPGKKKIKEEYFTTQEGRVVKKRLTDMVFLFGENFHLAVGPCTANDNQVINFVNNRLLELRLNQGAQLGHAAAVIGPDSKKGLMMAGFSGAGKSTLSLEIMNHGVNFLSNDRVLLAFDTREEKMIMEGVAKHPRINPGTIIHNPNLSSIIPESQWSRYKEMGDELWDLEEKYDGMIDQCYGTGKFHLVNEAHFLILLNWKRTDDELVINKIDPSQRRDLLPAFMKQTGLFYLPSSDGSKVERKEEDYIKLLNKLEVYELSGGVNFSKAAQFCLELLK